MKLKESYSVIIILTLLMSGCTPYDFIPKSAGDNKDNLIAVLNYCRKDSNQCKYASAEFLVKNMGWHVSEENDGVYSDAAILSYDFLKEHIDHAVEQWQTSPYAKGLTFEEFCEYILPYRAVRGYGNNISAHERYDWMVKYIAIPDSIKDLKERIWYYNNAILALRAHGGKRNTLYHDGLNDLRYEDFVDCRDKAVQTCLNLRSIGIPCVVEHTIGYRTLRSHHYYCAVWDVENQQWIRFHGEGIKYYPGEDDWTSAELLNVYRDTYAPQVNSQYRLKDFKPYRFESPCQIDVTDNAVRIELPIEQDIEGCTPYLSTFHRTAKGSGLQPFTQGYVREDKIVFEYAVPTVWYVVTVYPEGKEKVVSRPFWVNKTESGRGNIKYADFSPKESELEDAVLYRKYPIKEFLTERARTLIGATIVGANKADFSDAHLLWRLDSMPLPKVAHYPFLKTGDYKYYRLNTPEVCEVSVLEWLTADGVLSISDKNNKAYDRNMTTAPTDSSAITLMLPQKERIVAVNLAPINADNAVTPGHVYQLYTWRNYYGWVLHSTQRAMADSIEFSGVPKGSLLWLKDITKGQEEMPMFYKDKRQQFLYTPYNNHPAQYRVN